MVFLMKNFLKYRLFSPHLILPVIIAFFYIVKFGGQSLVGWLVDRQRFDLLSIIFPTGDHSLSATYFYGLAEQQLLGPISQVIAAVALIIIALRYFKTASTVQFTAAIFLFLILTKWETLFWPPYGDAIGGPFAEAIWLLRNNFHYVDLLNQPDYMQGGPRVYLFSIYPTYLAVVMKLCIYPWLAFAVLRQFVFWMVACAVALLRNIFRKIFPDDIAILAALMFLFYPLTQHHAESLNMDVPCMFFMMLSAHSLLNKKFFFASLYAAVAAFIKGTGVVACGAVGIILFKFFLDDVWQRKFDGKRFVEMVWMAAVPLALVLSKYILNDPHVSSGMISLFSGWPLIGGGWYWMRFPLIFHFFVVSLVIYGVDVCLRRFKGDARDAVIITMYVFVFMFFAFFANFSILLPRYVIGMIPFLVFCFFSASSLVIRPHFLRKIAAITMIIFFAYGSYGRFYQQLALYHNIFERSLEYRNDFYVDRELTRRVEDRYGSFTIVAPMLSAQKFGLTELGYVDQDLDVMIYGFLCQYGDIRNFSGLTSLNRDQTVFIVKDWDVDPKAEFAAIYPIHPADEILDEIAFGARKAWVLKNGLGIGILYRMLILGQQGLLY